METSIPTSMPAPAPEIIPPVSPIPPSPTPQRSRILLFIALMAIIILALSGYIAYDKFYVKSSPTPLTSPQPSPSPSPDPTENWTLYSDPVLNIQYKLPPRLNLLEMSGKEIPGETGTQYCLIYVGSFVFRFIKPVYAGGAACEGGELAFGSISKNYQAGREGGFGDFPGYTKDTATGRYYTSPDLNPYTEIRNSDAEEIVNPNGINILVVTGSSEPIDRGGEIVNFPVAGTPGEGYIGALINVPTNPNYRGFNIQTSIKNKQTFLQILSTFMEPDIPNSTTLNEYRDPEGGYSFYYPSNWQLLTSAPDEFRYHDYSNRDDWMSYFNSPEGLNWWLSGKMFSEGCRGPILQNTNDTKQLIAIEIVPADSDGGFCWSVGYFFEEDKWKVAKSYIYPISRGNFGKSMTPEWKGDFIKFRELAQSAKWRVFAGLANRETYVLRGQGALTTILSTFKFTQ